MAKEKEIKTKPDEEVLYESHPAMFRARPATFVLCLILSLVVVGLIIFFVWWLKVKKTTITVTTTRTRLRRGLISVHMTEVWHDHVRNVKVKQSAYERIFGVGTIGIASAGKSDYEIKVSGLPDVYKIKDLIDANRQDVRSID